jgi:hypothetical protein
LIHQHSGGVPRLINLLCDTALVYGFADQKKTIDADLVEEMISERMENSLLPLAKVDKSKKVVNDHDEDFPWINPNGGTEGLKPAAEKKTVEKKPAKNRSSKSETAGPTAEKVAVADEALIRAAKDSLSNKKTAAAGDFNSRDNSRAEDRGQHAKVKDSSASVAEHKASSVVTVSEPVPDELDKARINGRIMFVTVAAVVLVLSAAIVSFMQQPELPDEVRGRLAEAEKMKQEMLRMQREREAALEKARLEEQQRVQAEQAAIEAASQEQAARAAAALAAEKALQATRKAEELAEKQRLEEQKLRDERRRIQLEKRQAELEWQRLALERKQAKEEQERLELEKAKAEKPAQ